MGEPCSGNDDPLEETYGRGPGHCVGTSTIMGEQCSGNDDPLEETYGRGPGHCVGTSSIMGGLDSVVSPRGDLRPWPWPLCRNLLK
jgi:hypothetical protein